MHAEPSSAPLREYPERKIPKPLPYKARLGFLLFGLGLLGILSLLTQPLALDNLPPEVLAQIPPETLRYLMLVNPAILLLLAVVLGTLLHDKVKLGAPVLQGWLTNSRPRIPFSAQLPPALAWGVIGGALALGLAAAFRPQLPQEFVALGEKIQPGVAVRLLYGGITEEILMRFGLMTLLVWLGAQVARSQPAAIYWIGIVLASLIFALGHFPVAYQAVGNPSPMLLLYILLGNGLLGIGYGWLYWRKGLEAAFIAHLATHVVFMGWGWLTA